MLLVPLPELVPRVRVALAAEMLERVGGGDAADTRAYLEGQPERHPFHQSPAVGVADTGRIDNPMRCDRRHIDATTGRGVDRRSLFPSRNEERPRLHQDVGLPQSGLLAQ